MKNTYIVIPHEKMGDQMATYATHPEQLSIESANLAIKTLQSAGMPGERLITSSGLVDTIGNLEKRSSEEMITSREENTPRVLESIGALLMNDLTAEQIDQLSEYAEVVENFEIPLQSPVDDEPAATTQDWHLNKVNISAAQNQGLTGQGVRIGILDTGIDSAHADFIGKSISFAEYDTNGYLISTTPRDAASHGTHVSGIAAGSSYGIAPDADLAVAAVLTTRKPSGMVGYFAQILAGLNWLAHSNHSQVGISQCSVINASLGGTGYNNYLHPSVDIIRQVPGSLVVASIGNSGGNGVNMHGSPGNYDNLIGIGATDSHDIAAGFSDWGIESGSGVLKPDMAAPGVNVWSAVPTGGHIQLSGTSMASPMVAGAAALLIQKFPNLHRNPNNLQTRLLRLVDPAVSADPANFQQNYNRVGAGRLDLTTI